MSTATTVAVIPPGITLSAMSKAMRGLGACYPEGSLSLGNDPHSGGMAIVYDPAAADPDEDAEPKPKVHVKLGGAKPGDLLAYAYSAEDQMDGIKALVIWLARLLEGAGAANYLTFTVELPGAGEYGMTIQRGGGMTPAGRIAELEQQIASAASAARMVAEFHQMIGALPWTGPIEQMPARTLTVRNRLIRSEVKELVDATLAGDLVGIAQELADVVYVAYGTAFTYGIDLDAVLAEVHRSNMTKDPGPTGKAVKGERFIPADVAGVLASTTP